MKSLIALVALISAVRGDCEMRPLVPACQDTVNECLDCMTITTCRVKCDETPGCKGYTFAEDYKRCNLWMGTDCSDKVEWSVNYYEKYCDDVKSYAPFESKADNKEEPRNCPRSCPRMDIPANVLHNMKNNHVGARVQFFCKIGKLIGSRTIECRPDASWSDQAPVCVAA